MMNKKMNAGSPGFKQITGLALVIIAAFASAIATIYGLRLWPGSASCSLCTLFYVFVYTRKIPEVSKNCKIWIAVFSVIFSAASIQGALLRIQGEPYTGLVRENYMGYFRFRDAVAMVILAFSIYHLIRLLLPYLHKAGERLCLMLPEEYESSRFLNGTMEQTEESPKKKPKEPKRKNSLFSKKWKDSSAKKTRSFLRRHRSILLPMTVLFLGWLPYFISYYPGFILGDSCSSIRQALGLEEFSNHYPVMYTLFIRLCLNIGDLFGSLTFGCAVYTLIQMVFLAYSLARMIQWLGRRGFPWQLCMLLTVFFAITPFFAQVSIAMWKDPVFSAAILLWTLLLLDHIRFRKNGTEPHLFRDNLYFLLKNAVLVLLICFSRNNGIYIAVFCTIVFILVFLFSGKKRKRLEGIKEAIVCTLAAILFCVFITGPVYEAAGVKPVENVERVGVMMNQMARTVALSGKMSEEDKTFMNRLLPLKQYKQAYRPCVVDLLKWDEDFDGDYLNEHMDEFYLTWFSMGFKNPRSYFQAWELLTFGYWMPNQWELFYDSTNIIKGNLHDLPFDDKLNKKIQTVYGGKKHQLKAGPRLLFDCKGSIAGLGFVSWVLLFALLITVLRKKWTAMIALMPSIGLFMTLLLASPYYYWQRYGLAEYFLFPVYIFLILCCSVQKKQTYK